MDIPLTFKLEIKGTLEYLDADGEVIQTVEFSTRQPIDVETGWGAEPNEEVV